MNENSCKILTPPMGQIQVLRLANNRINNASTLIGFLLFINWLIFYLINHHFGNDFFHDF